MHNMLKGRYQLEEALNTGGMSVIFLALDTYTNERVAVKIMTAIHEDDKRNLKAQERFQREISIAQKIDHPHVLPILDAGYTFYQDEEVPFLVTSYIEEGSLADYMEQVRTWERWTLRQTADAITQAAESLYYLHTRKPPIVHQDVKPGNFLYRSINLPERAVYLYLCDFGISRLQRTEHALASEVIGTAAYMAPEQLQSQVMPASDQYALAIMACQLLTGKLPIQAQTNPQYAEAHLHDLPIPPSRLNPRRAVNAEVDRVILRALEKSPERRYPTIQDFGLAFAQALSNAETRNITPPLNGPNNGPHQNGRGPQLQPDQQVKPLASINIDPFETTGNQSLDEPLPAKPARAATISTRGPVAPIHLPLNRPVAIKLPARPRWLYWSHDGNSLACVLYEHAPIYIRPPNQIHEARVKDAQLAVGASWSADGRVLAITTRDAIRFWDTIKHIELPLALSLPRPIEGLHWSAQDRLVIWTDNQILLYPITYAQLSSSQLAPAQRLDPGTMRSSNADVLRWSPDGAYLAAGGSNGDLKCWQPDRTDEVWHIAALKQKINSIAWSSDSSLLLVALRNNQVVGWDVRTRQKALQWEKLPVMPRIISIAKSGRIVLASSAKHLLFGFPNENTPSATAAGQLLAAWSPTRRELATLDEKDETVLILWHE
jgi:serine/threonine protein kinase